jgi:signal transduction histidine kinase
VIAALGRLYRRRGIAFAYEETDDLAVACDPHDFSEIIATTPTMPPSGRARVAISCARRDGGAEISVEDDGPGIPAPSVETVFGFGEKLDEHMPGSGIGLAITRELVTLYDGRIAIERSVALGGTAVRARLPLSPV